MTPVVQEFCRSIFLVSEGSKAKTFFCEAHSFLNVTFNNIP